MDKKYITIDKELLYSRRNYDDYRKINDVNIVLSQFNNPTLEDLDFIFEYVTYLHKKNESNIQEKMCYQNNI